MYFFECLITVTVEVLDRFDTARGCEYERFSDPFLWGNVAIEDAITQYYTDSTVDNLIKVLNKIQLRMRANGHFLIPAITLESGTDFELQHIQTSDSERWLVGFTSQEEYEKGESATVMPLLR